MSAEARECKGWATAYVHATGPGECSIDLIDEGAPGNSTFMEALSFSLPAEVEASTGTGRDARVIEEATAELADCGYVPVSWKGVDGYFIVEVGITDWKMDELWDALYSQ